MSGRVKIKRNDPCPCQNGAKFKHCCLGKVDWQAIFDRKLDFRPYLSVRGRNLFFASLVSEALQLDLTHPISLKDYKAAFTAEAVRRIHEALLAAWPVGMDIVQALRGLSGDVSGLYVGNYGPQYIARALLRHSIYANKIVLFDPFVYPPSVRDEYNPILNPEQYRAQTLKNVNLWYALLPWIHAGIVVVIRAPFDFDPRLNWDLLKAQERKMERSAELRQAMEECLRDRDTADEERFAFEHRVLSAPDSYLREKFREHGIGTDQSEVEEVLAFVRAERERNPDFLEPFGPRSQGRLSVMTSGASYSGAKLTAALTGSYLFTDISFRWKEIEFDRKSHSAENQLWAPFAKALQNAPFSYLDNVRLEHALALRQEQRLGSLRGFFTRVWRSVRQENEFDSANALLLSEELGHEVREAEQEWKKIDTDLLKMVSAAGGGTLLAAGPLIASGHAFFLAAAVAVSGLAPIAVSTRLRQSFPDRFPAAFFMKIDASRS